MNYNRVILAGYLTRDPELRVTPKGTAIAQFGLAMNRTWRDEAGNQQSKACFVDCKAWGRTGEAINKYFSKGTPIHVEGYLEFEQWEDKTTQQKRSKLSVTVESFQFVEKAGECAPAGDGSGEDTREQRPAAPPPRTPTPAPRAGFGGRPAPQHGIDDEQVPF